MNDTLRGWEPRILSVLRIVVALLYLQHGLTKFFGFPGTAPSAMPLFPVILGGLIEIIGSILLLVGLWSRPAAFIMSGEMAIAYWYAHFIRSRTTTAATWRSCTASCFSTSSSPVRAPGASTRCGSVPGEPPPPEG